MELPLPDLRGGPGRAARPRTQSSIAVRGMEGPWFLANASPDLRQQLETLPPEPTAGPRAAPVAGVLLTDAEIDHTAGLLLLRESATPLQVYGSADVRRALTDGYPVLRVLAGYSGVDWHALEPGATVAIAVRRSRSSRSRPAATRRCTSPGPARRSRRPASCSATPRAAAC